MNRKTSIEGGCQCGAIRYQISSKPIVVYTCHCTDCQRQASSAFGISVWFNRENFELQMGKLSFWSTTSDKGNSKLCAFCPHCGSRIYHGTDHDAPILSVKGGSLDVSGLIKPVAHLWCRSAQPWIRELILLDARTTPCFQTEPDDFDQIVDLYKSAITPSTNL